jgi:hypothetical protein
MRLLALDSIEWYRKRCTWFHPDINNQTHTNIVILETGASHACLCVDSNPNSDVQTLQAGGPGALQLSTVDEEPWGGIEGTTSSDFDPKTFHSQTRNQPITLDPVGERAESLNIQQGIKNSR